MHATHGTFSTMHTIKARVTVHSISLGRSYCCTAGRKYGPQCYTALQCATQYNIIYNTIIYNTALHTIALYSTVLRNTTVNHYTLYCIAHIALHHASLNCTSLHYTAIHYPSLHYKSSKDNSVPCWVFLPTLPVSKV